MLSKHEAMSHSMTAGFHVIGENKKPSQKKLHIQVLLRMKYNSAEDNSPLMDQTGIL